MNGSRACPTNTDRPGLFLCELAGMVRDWSVRRSHAHARRAAGRPFGARSVATLLLAAACAVLPAVSHQVQAQTVTLVSNTGQISDSSPVFVGLFSGTNFRQAQQFTAGNHSDGYVLKEVLVSLGDIDGNAKPKVSIYTDSSGDPGSSLFVLSNPSSVVSNRLNTFTAPTGSTLSANTKYWVVFENENRFNGNTYQVTITTSFDEDSGGSSDWEIGNEYKFRTASTWSADTAHTLRIAVEGSPKTPATGAPAITGTPQVRGTLTAGIGTIADINGLPDNFPDDYTLQWIRVDADGSSNPTDIDRANAGTYTPVRADVGKRIRLEVSFADDNGSTETVMRSAAYPVHGYRSPVIAAGEDRLSRHRQLVHRDDGGVQVGHERRSMDLMCLVAWEASMTDTIDQGGTTNLLQRVYRCGLIGDRLVRN